MDKIEQMNELIKKVQENPELKKEVATVLQAAAPGDTSNVDKWLADKGYNFTFQEMLEYLEDGIPLSDERLEAVAGGKDARETGSLVATIGLSVAIGVGSLVGHIICEGE